MLWLIVLWKFFDASSYRHELPDVSSDRQFSLEHQIVAWRAARSLEPKREAVKEKWEAEKDSYTELLSETRHSKATKHCTFPVGCIFFQLGLINQRLS